MNCKEYFNVPYDRHAWTVKCYAQSNLNMKNILAQILATIQILMQASTSTNSAFAGTGSWKWSLELKGVPKGEFSGLPN